MIHYFFPTRISIFIISCQVLAKFMLVQAKVHSLISFDIVDIITSIYGIFQIYVWVYCWHSMIFKILDSKSAFKKIFGNFLISISVLNL